MAIRRVVYGASGHGKVIADILRAAGIEAHGFVDDGRDAGSTVMGLPVLGGAAWLEEAIRAGEIHVALGIGDNRVRERVAGRVRSWGGALLTAVHPTAVIAPSATIGEGAVVMATAVVNPEAIVGEGAIVNTGAIVEHDCRVGRFAHLSPNAALGGAVIVGDLTHVGIGASVLPLVKIGSLTIVGGGALVRRDLPDRVVAAGVPAEVIRTIEAAR